MNETKSTSNPIHCKCGGTGQYVVKDDDGIIGSLATYPCPCRLKLPRREGKARWWSLEGRGEFDHESMTKQHQFTASIRRELPMSEDAPTR